MAAATSFPVARAVLPVASLTLSGDFKATASAPSAVPAATAQMVKSLATNDGNCLLFNVHISSKGGAPLEFPDSDAALPD